jgi:hypothetical protein
MRMRRTILPGLFMVFLVLSGCSHFCRNTCPQVTAEAVHTPVVVMIDSGLNAHPDPVHLHPGQFVTFMLLSGNLDIEDDFLEGKGHDGGQAWGQVKKDAKYGEHKYTVVNLTTGRKNDPEVMIDP